MDIVVLLLTFFCTYVFVAFVALAIARLMFPKVETEENEEQKTKRIKSPVVKRFVNRTA